MGILDRIFGRGEKAVGGMDALRSDNIWQNWLDGEPISMAQVDRPYLQLASVYACIDKIATNISQTEFVIQNTAGDEVFNKPANRLFEKPNERDTRYTFWVELVSNLEITGRGYMVYGDRLKGAPISLWVPNSRLMHTFTGDDGRVAYYEYGEGAKRKRIPAEDVLFFRYWHPDSPYDGMSPLTAARTEIELQWYANTYNTNFFKKGAQLKGFFSSTTPGRITPEKQEEISRMVDKAATGIGNAHKVPVFNGLTWNAMAISQKDMEFLAMMEATDKKIYQVFGVPEVLLKASDATFANMEEAKKYFWNQTLLPKMALIEDTLNYGLFKKAFPGLEGRFKTWEIPELQLDLNTAAQTAKYFYDMGVPFVAINERMNLGFPDDMMLEDRTPFNPFAMPPADEEDEDTEGDTAIEEPKESKEEIIEADKIRRRVEREKNLAFTHYLLIQEGDETVKRFVKYENELIPLVKRFWSKVSKDIHEWIVGQKAAELSPEEIAFITSKVKDAEWFKELMDIISPQLTQMFISGQKRTVWGMGMSFDLPSQNAIMHVIGRGIKLEGAVDSVKDEILSALIEGKPSAELAKEVSKIVDTRKHNAQTIARTETTVAYNAGRVDGMKELGIKKKVWINAGDDKVRHNADANHDINGEIANIEDKFSNGQFYPGDGTAAQVCNCRCTVGSVLE